MAKKTEERDERETKEGDDGRPRRRRRSTSDNANGDRSRRRGGARAVAERAKRELGELMGHMPESVSSLERDEDGWRVQLEFLELERIPNTSDILATYEVVIDDDGEIASYRRGGPPRRGSDQRG